MLYDALARLPFATLFLSDQGVLSRAEHLELFNRPWALSIYFGLADPLQVKAAMLVHALAALALALGFRTRLASIVCWIMLVSLQNRNPLILNGGDTLLCLYAFWAMLLPLNARLSLDRLLSPANPSSTYYHAIPGFAIVAQTIIVYAFTWLLKSGELWLNGDAVAYVLRNLGLVSAGGVWLQQFDSLHRPLTILTYHWEWFGLLLALCPWANATTRSIAIAGFVAMHLGFAATLDLALFPFVSILGWVILIPAPFWNRLPSPKNLSPLPFLRRLRGGPIMNPGPWSTIVALHAIVLVFIWNLSGLPDSPLKNQVPKPIANALHLFKLRQKWSMFAANPPRTSTWYAIEAQLVNGDSYDLLAPDQLFSLSNPKVFTDRLPDRRWGKFLGNIAKRRYQDLRENFVSHFVERWNAAAPPERQIHNARLLSVKERVDPARGYYDRNQRTLKTLTVKRPFNAPRQSAPEDEPDTTTLEDETDAL